MNPEVALYRVVSRCVSVLAWNVYPAVVGAAPVVESPGSCRGGAGSIPVVRMAPLPKRREDKQAAGCSECAPTAAFKARKPRALPEGAVVCFCLWRGAGVCSKNQRGAPTAAGSAGVE